jgi:hypothetical protein
MNGYATLRGSTIAPSPPRTNVRLSTEYHDIGRDGLARRDPLIRAAARHDPLIRAAAARHAPLNRVVAARRGQYRGTGRRSLATLGACRSQN